MDDKLKAIKGFGDFLEQYTEAHKQVRDIVYELKDRYYKENPVDKMFLDAMCYNHHQKKYNCVYFIRNIYNNLVKIGCSTDVVTRIKTIRSVCKNYLGMDNTIKLEGIIDTSFINPQIVEKFFHNKYDKYRRFGEWFELPDKEWKLLKKNYIPNAEFLDDMTDDTISEKLNEHDIIHNIMYIGDIDDDSFNDLLFQEVNYKSPLEDDIEAYVDSITNLLTGIYFQLPKCFQESDFYRFLLLELDKFKVEKTMEIPYTFQHMKEWYDKNY